MERAALIEKTFPEPVEWRGYLNPSQYQSYRLKMLSPSHKFQMTHKHPAYIVRRVLWYKFHLQLVDSVHRLLITPLARPFSRKTDTKSWLTRLSTGSKGFYPLCELRAALKWKMPEFFKLNFYLFSPLVALIRLLTLQMLSMDLSAFQKLHRKCRNCSVN